MQPEEILIPGEDRAVYNEFRHDTLARLGPRNVLERHIAELFLSAAWRAQRAVRHETTAALEGRAFWEKEIREQHPGATQAVIDGLMATRRANTKNDRTQQAHTRYERAMSSACMSYWKLYKEIQAREPVEPAPALPPPPPQPEAPKEPAAQPSQPPATYTSTNTTPRESTACERSSPTGSAERNTRKRRRSSNHALPRTRRAKPRRARSQNPARRSQHRDSRTTPATAQRMQHHRHGPSDARLRQDRPAAGQPPGAPCGLAADIHRPAGNGRPVDGKSPRRTARMCVARPGLAPTLRQPVRRFTSPIAS